MDAINMGSNRTARRVVAGLVSVMAAALLAGGTAAAEPRSSSVVSAQQVSHLAASTYFGEARTSTGYIPGL